MLAFLPFLSAHHRGKITYSAYRHMLAGQGPVVIGRDDLDVSVGPFYARVIMGKPFGFVFRPKPNGNFMDVFTLDLPDHTPSVRNAQALAAAFLTSFDDLVEVQWEATRIRVKHMPDQRLTIFNDQNFGPGRKA
ncbi:hypothetical protein RCKICKAPOO_97 [Rhodobacter phage RcKickapoo]|nr:hypothetical protein RCTIPTONUS_93 [Rhodobacter phage RcTiptonus]UUV43838.1 hypothetical protein RCKICKAPOO_97 [Rhodobacter phage RcKickapoo]